MLPKGSKYTVLSRNEIEAFSVLPCQILIRYREKNTLGDRALEANQNPPVM